MNRMVTQNRLEYAGLGKRQIKVNNAILNPAIESEIVRLVEAIEINWLILWVFNKQPEKFMVCSKYKSLSGELMARRYVGEGSRHR